MVLATTTAPHDAFIQALTDLDPHLAGAFHNVEDQTAREDTRWQYLWVGYQQHQGILTPDREAAKLFQAFTATQPDNPETPQDASEDFAKHIARTVANPYHRMVDEYERDERRWVNEMSFRLADDEPAFTASQRRSLDTLLQQIRDDLSYAETYVLRGLRFHNPHTYARGISMMERLQDTL